MAIESLRDADEYLGNVYWAVRIHETILAFKENQLESNSIINELINEFELKARVCDAQINHGVYCYTSRSFKEFVKMLEKLK